MTKPGEFHRPSRERLKRSAKSVGHLQTRKAFAAEWRNIASTLYTPRVCKGMPRFVRKLAKTFWTVDPLTVASAITDGDPAFFAAFLLRLDQIDCAMVKAKRSIAARAPVTRAKFVINGFLETSVQVLIENGGEWPPTDPS